jgi:hypothetical protein
VYLVIAHLRECGEIERLGYDGERGTSVKQKMKKAERVIILTISPLFPFLLKKDFAGFTTRNIRRR